MSFNQYRTNPGANVSNFKGRTDTPKAWPSTAVSTWMNSALFSGGSRVGWFAIIQSTAQVVNTAGGSGLDSNEDIYLVSRMNSGNTAMWKISGSDEPSLLARSKINTNGNWGDVWNSGLTESTDYVVGGGGIFSQGQTGYAISWPPVTSTGNNVASAQGAVQWRPQQASNNSNDIKYYGAQQINPYKSSTGNSGRVSISMNARNQNYQIQWGCGYLNGTSPYNAIAGEYYGDTNTTYLSRTYFYHPLNRDYMSGVDIHFEHINLYGYVRGSSSSVQSKLKYKKASGASANFNRAFWTPSLKVGSQDYAYLVAPNYSTSSATDRGVEIVKIDAAVSASEGAVQWSKVLHASGGTMSDTNFWEKSMRAQPVTDTDGNVYFSLTYYSTADSKWHTAISKVSPAGVLLWCNNLEMIRSNGTNDAIHFVSQMEINSFNDIIVAGPCSMGDGGGGTAGPTTVVFSARLSSDGGGTGAALPISNDGATIQYTPNTELSLKTSTVARYTNTANAHEGGNWGYNTAGVTNTDQSADAFASTVL
tara:strand:+ start:19 stop:1620 length:1602 start_codon:yes stop_codon:yes gene_type:complete